LELLPAAPLIVLIDLEDITYNEESYGAEVIIDLDNADGHFDSWNPLGNAVTLSFGYNTGAGDCHKQLL